MTKKGFISKFLLTSIVFTLLSMPAHAAQKVAVGASCKVKKQSVTNQDMTYTCVKKGKKLVWNKGVKAVVTKTPEVVTQTPEVAAMTYSNPTQQSSKIEICKTNENNANRRGMQNALAAGFPSVTNLAIKTGTVKWALVPLDFTDIPGESNFRSRVNGQMAMLSDWFTTVSEGKFKVEWVVAEKWTTLPGKSSDYIIPFSDGPDRSPAIADFWKKAIAESDKNFDYTDIETVNFILPLSQTVVSETLQGFPWEQAVKNYVPEEGKVSSFSIPGAFMNHPSRQYWSYWAHEFGHAMGVPHIGSSRTPNPFLGLDLMSSQDGYTRELSGWLRFVAGWLDDEKVFCQEFSKLQSVDLTLVPLSSTSAGLKMVVIPISDSKTLVIESRRETKFSCKMPTQKNGVLAYLFDPTLGHGDNFLTPVGPEGRSPEGSSDCQVTQYPDPLLYKGQKINVEGMTLEVLDSANFDKIRISKN